MLDLHKPMRRRTAGLLVTGAVLLVAGYAAWCGRSFYLKPRIDRALWIPEEVMAAIPQAAEKAGMMRLEEFDTRKFIHHLCHPYEKRAGASIIAKKEAQDAIRVMRSEPLLWFHKNPSIYFILRAGRWQQATELEYKEFKGRWNVDPWKKSSPPKGTEDLMNKALSCLSGGRELRVES